MCANLLRKVYDKFLWSPLGPYKWLGNFVIFPMMGWMRTHHVLGLNKPYDKILQFKNKHLNEKCYVIATGPSLTEEDLLLTKGKTSFAVNTIFTVFDRTSWRPTYYVLDDPAYHRKLNQKYNLDFEKFALNNCFLNSENINISSGTKNIFLNINYLDHIYRYGVSQKFKYTGDLLYGFYDNYSVTQDSIILAIYMGFKEIYLLGADNDYLGKKQHFDGITEEADAEYNRALKIQSANDMGYEFVKSVANKYGVKIYNVTRGGRVKAFERMTLEESLKKWSEDDGK